MFQVWLMNEHQAKKRLFICNKEISLNGIYAQECAKWIIEWCRKNKLKPKLFCFHYYHNDKVLIYCAALIFTNIYQTLSEGSQFQWHQEYPLLSQAPPQPHISGNRKKIDFFVTKIKRDHIFTTYNSVQRPFKCCNFYFVDRLILSSMPCYYILISQIRINKVHPSIFRSINYNLTKRPKTANFHGDGGDVGEKCSKVMLFIVGSLAIVISKKLPISLFSHSVKVGVWVVWVQWHGEVVAKGFDAPSFSKRWHHLSHYLYQI